MVMSKAQSIEPDASLPGRDPRFDILFEPVRIGHLTAKNRFYQPPHCNGMGGLRPQAHAAMRGVKAEGGWAVVNTEHCSIHPTSDLTPEVLQTLWDDGDIASLALMCEAVHKHGALAGVQLAYAAYYNANKYTREIPMGPMARPVDGHFPIQVRAMDHEDIRNLRRWMRQAAARARQAGFDIVNVDANFSTIAFQFMSPRNKRTDEYGGPLKNRVRLLKELIEETREGVQGDCAVTVRLIVDELCGPRGLQVADEGLAAIQMIGELPDLWDIVVGNWADDSPTSRFAPENDHEPFMAGIKSVTTKPVVGVGRFTSPDTMVSLIRRGVLDMIGATRPSIADPFLPRKIEEGRYEDIRECIGCNICVSSHYMMTNLRCTQNPTMGEEWRKGWHPERIQQKTSDRHVLVVGGGPAGLECARALGQRGYTVTLAEKSRQLGGRVTREGELPGLREWLRVRDWRVTQLGKMPNVGIYLESEMTAAEIESFGADHVILATGSSWRADGIGRLRDSPVETDATIRILTPDDVMAGVSVTGAVTVYDEDHYYMGGVIAEKLARQGARVTLVTPASEISAFGSNTLEVPRITRRLDEVGVTVATHHVLSHIAGGRVVFAHIHTAHPLEQAAETIVMVTARVSDDRLYNTLLEKLSARGSAAPLSISRIGDCLAPGAIFHAVYSGHKFAREFETKAEEILFRRERIVLDEVLS
jgi:dimethylamine/trimethylamine dehydrogenase